MQRVGQVIGRLDLNKFTWVRGRQFWTNWGLGFVCVFSGCSIEPGAGQIPFSRGLGLPTELMETNSLSSPGTQEARAACPVEI